MQAAKNLRNSAPGPTGGLKTRVHAYPQELVSFILDLQKDPLFMDGLRTNGSAPPAPLPERAVLEQVISVCYQASLLREEERAIEFRLIICDPEILPAQEGPPTGLQPLTFAQTRPFNEFELQRLTPAVDFSRMLVAISIDPQNGPQIWGIINSGNRWLQEVLGGRKTCPPLPACPLIYVTGPGQISVSLGPKVIASLNGGQINYPTQNVFAARWLSESFASVRTEMRELHAAARARSKKPWARLDPQFARMVAQQVVRRIISVIRNSRHGGMLVYLPPEMAPELEVQNRYLSIKYQFREDEPRQRFRTLMLRIINTAAELLADANDPEKIIGWEDYVTCQREELVLLDEAIFDLAYFIASLSAIDGAVVLTKRSDLLGFGGFILGDIDEVQTVARALDTEGDQVETELSEGVGTRHRAAYRLCHELHDAFAIVISQDGDVRLVKWHNGSVTYWNQAPIGMPR
ncbi:MAG: putative sensor domain DACNV-containing protein [Desulfobaccales bacterium]